MKKGGKRGGERDLGSSSCNREEGWKWPTERKGTFTKCIGGKKKGRGKGMVSK